MSSSPTRAVLAAFEEGESSLAGVAARTGLPADLVPLIVDELVRLGALQRTELSGGCPAGGCGGCAAAAPRGPTCSAGPTGRTRPVLLTLGVPPRGAGSAPGGPPRR